MPEKVVIGTAELWHGDCREVLPLLQAAHAVITDPRAGALLHKQIRLPYSLWLKEGATA